MKIKLWETDYPEWYAAATKEDALTIIREFGGYDDEEMKEIAEELTEVSDNSMGILRFTEEDGTVRTFREELNRLIAAGEKFPCGFAIGGES